MAQTVTISNPRPAARHRVAIAAAAVAALAALTAPASAQTPRSPADSDAPTEIEIADGQCVVGSRTSDLMSRARCPWTGATPFELAWDDGRIRLVVGGETLVRHGRWRADRDLRISARGSVRLRLATVGGEPSAAVVDGAAASSAPVELLVPASGRRRWTVSGTIERSGPATPDDAIRIDLDRADDPWQGRQPWTTSGAMAGPYVTAEATRLRAGPARTLNWNENVGDARWSVAANWNPAGPPVSGDLLRFEVNNIPPMNNDLPGLQVGGVTVTRKAEIGGNGLTLAGGSTSSIDNELTVSSLSGGGRINLYGKLVVAQSANTTFAGTFVGGNDVRVVKQGGGTLTLTGTSVSAPLIEVQGGGVVVNGGTVGDVDVRGGGRFALTGDARAGDLHPNDSEFGVAGAVWHGTSGDLQLNNGIYHQRIDSASSFSRLIVNGKTQPGNAELRLTLAPGYVPAVGTTFVIIENDGGDGVVNSFRGLDEQNNRNTFVVDGVTFQITYRYPDGSGNDVALTVLEAPTPTQPPDLAIIKTHAGTFTQGQDGATYTITVSNRAGAGPSTGVVTVSDALPAGLIATALTGADWVCTVGTLTCTRSTVLAAGAAYPPITLTVDVADDAPPSVTNSATVSGGGDTSPSTAQDPTTIAQTPVAVPNLTVAKSHTGNFTQGQSGATYAIVVSNSAGAGPSSGTITLTDALPPGLTATALAGSDWSCTVATLTCTRAAGLGAGESAPPITLTVTVAADAPASVTNSVTVSGGGDTTPSTGTDPTTITPAPVQRPNLTLAKSHTGDFVQGQTGAVYTLTVANAAGGAPTSGLVSVTDTLPAGLTATAIGGPDWDCTLATLTCTRSSALAAGASYPAITLTVNVAADAAGSVTNTATVAGGGDDTPATATDQTTITPTTGPTAPNVTIAKSHVGDFTQGQAGAVYTITVSNQPGAAPTSGVITVTDALPPGLTATGWTGADWACTLGTLTCTRTNVLAPGASYSPITLTVNVASDAPTSLTNSATVSGGGDNTPATATDPTTIVPVTVVGPNLTLAKSHGGVFTQGQTGALYTLVVTNQAGAGPTTGTVTVTDTLPAGLTATALAGPDWTCTVETLSCTRDAVLAPGASYPPITLTVNVAADAPFSVTNSATVAGGGDTTPSTTTDPTTISPATTPDLTVSKSHAGDFVVGQTGAGYAIVVRNAGTAPTAGEVVVEDLVPPGLTPTAATGTGWSCTLQAQLVSCRRSDPLPNGQSWPEISLAVNVTSQVANAVTNVAMVRGGGDVTPDNNSAADPTGIDGQPQLTIEKSHNGPVVPGQQGVEFRIEVLNAGSAPTSGTVTVTDTLPAGLQLVDAVGDGWSCSRSDATATCSRSDMLEAGATWPLVLINVDIAANAASVTNEARVDGGGDTTPGDNVARDLVAVSPPNRPNLIIAKSHVGDLVHGAQGASYRVTVRNLGQVPTSGVVTVVDALPAGLAPTSAGGDGWSCGIAGQRVTCQRDDALPVGGAWPAIAVVATVAPEVNSAVNVANVSGGGDETPADNTALDEATIRSRAPDLRLTKQHADPFAGGQQGATYRLTVSNVGDAPTTGEVVVTDSVPPGMTPRSASGAGWSCGVQSPTVTCRRSDALGPGAAYPEIALLVDVAANASSVSNVAVLSGGGDARPDNNTAVDFTNVNVTTDATITLTLDAPLVLGAEVDYVAQVTNLGPGRVGGETRVVTDLPTGLIPILGVGAGWSCTISDRQVLCSRFGGLDVNQVFPLLNIRARVAAGAGVFTVGSTLLPSADANEANNHAEVTATASTPTAALSITKSASVQTTTIGGSVAYRIAVTNVGDVRIESALVRDLPPRGFTRVEASTLTSSRRSPRPAAPERENEALLWSLGTLQPQETVAIEYRVVVGAEAGAGPQDNRATTQGLGPLNRVIAAGPAVATVVVSTDTFTLLQALVGRVFEDVDGDGAFGDADRPLGGARVITSTGQAAITDPAGLYNIPSLGAGSVAVSLDRATVPGQLTTVDQLPGDRSWTRLLRTPVGGGTLLRQNFALTAAEGRTTEEPAAVVVEPGAAPPPDPLPDAAAGATPPRRWYESRQGSSLLIALGELAVGRAAPEFGLFGKDGDAWGYASVFYQGGLGSPANRLTLAYDSHRRLNRTSERARLFELDPNDRAYPLFGDSSLRQEFATSNAKGFARLERGQSHLHYGDLVGDLPSSARDGGRWSSYQRHLTGAEVRLGDAGGNHLTVRAAQPSTAYARDTFAGSGLGFLALSNPGVLQGSETLAVETRDRRTPDRLLSRQVLSRGVDYELEPTSGAIFLLRRVSGLDSALNLVQIVATYEHEANGLEHTVWSGRAEKALGSVRVGASYFTEEPLANERFTVAGIDLDGRLPGGALVRAELPYSDGTPEYTRAVGSLPVPDAAAGDGFAAKIDLEQPVAWWHGMLRGAFQRADETFRNPFSSTITPGAQYAALGAEFEPRQPSRFRIGATDERYDTSRVDASRTTVSAAWSETIAGHVTLTGGYDARRLDQPSGTADSGLATAAVAVEAGSRFEARAAREENVGDEVDPTYPDQTTLGARLALGPRTTLFYSQRISDSAIVPIGDYSGTGFSSLATKGELNLGVESRVATAAQVTSRYQIQHGINGPDAFAVIGAATPIALGRGFAGQIGAEHGAAVSGRSGDYTSGALALAWLASDRAKVTTRYEATERDGYSGLFTAGVAARVYGGMTGLVRTQWLESDQPQSTGTSVGVLGALALRPLSHDRLGLLLSYQYYDRDGRLQTFGPATTASAWRHRGTADGYVQPLRRLIVHGKVGWEQVPSAGREPVNTYLGQGRVQITLLRFLDAAVEERYIRQPASDSSRRSTGAEIGVWPIADLRVAIGYHFQDTRDPYGRDLQGSDAGIYAAVSTKLSRLFNLLGSAPPR